MPALLQCRHTVVFFGFFGGAGGFQWHLSVTHNLIVWTEVWLFCRPVVHMTRLNKPSDTHTHTESPHWDKVQQLHTDACKQLDVHGQNYKGGTVEVTLGHVALLA